MNDGPIVAALPEGAVFHKARACRTNSDADRRIEFWFRCPVSEEGEPLGDMDDWTFRIFGTGHKITKEDLTTHEFLDTLFDGPFVWHLYRRTKK